MGQAISADHGQVFLFPPALEDWVPSNHAVRFIREFVSQLDIRGLGFKVRAVGHAGTDHYSAELLLSIWLYGYFERIRSSRKLEQALQTNLPLIWLAGLHRPDHSSLWRFWAANRHPLRQVFKETVLVADKLGMIDFTLMAVDGTKLLASSSRRTMWGERSLSEKQAAVDVAIAELEAAIGSDTSPGADPSIPEALAGKVRLREEIKAKRALLRQHGRKLLHPGEPDARVMKNQRTTDLCYNAQAVAEPRSQVVTAADVTTDENDAGQLVRMVDQVVGNLGRAPEETLADSGYSTEEQLALAEKREYPVLTTAKGAPDDPEDRFRADLFHYDPVADTVACPVNGTLLSFERERWRKHPPTMIRLFRCRNKVCPLRALCSKDRRGKYVEITPYRAARQNQAEKQKLAESMVKIKERARIIEPVFALTKTHGSFKRFTYRGLEGARTQWAVEMAGHNLRKVYNKWLHDRLGRAA